MPTLWSELPDAQVAVDADVTALLMRRVRDRQDYLREILRGDVGQDKINAAAIETTTSGSGTGLIATQFRHLAASGSVVVGTSATVDVDTGLAASLVRFPLPPALTDTGTGDLTAPFYLIPPSGNLHLRISRAANAVHGQTSGTVSWKVFVIDEG